MTVFPTDQWLKNAHFHPLLLCEKITKDDDSFSAKELYHYLTLHGMYRHSAHINHDWITHVQKKKIWKRIEEEEKKLQKQWDGPEVSIYIFPADPTNRELKRLYNGKAGLAFQSKIFLFIATDNSEEEIIALFTHEYHHACRLYHDKKQVEDYELLDTMILEGLAEYVVRKKFGPAYTSPWASYYSEDEIKKIYRKLIYPNRHISITDPKHERILYGFPPFPKMAGYAVGYYLVQQYQKKHQKQEVELLKTPATEMIKSSLEHH